MAAQPERECVFLTFDDGPDPQWTPQVLDVLAKADVSATFFMIGTAAQKNPALVREIAAHHAIGNHTFSHRHPWMMSQRQARAEVREGAAILSDIVGTLPRFYRPPHGRRRACMSDEANRCAQDVVLWDRSAVDWGMLGRAPGIAARLARVRSGEIVLMHDGRNRHNRPDQLVRVLPGFLRELGEKGLRVGTLR
jgi:peptidoglycan/xylan/chitin deacetylase (PgdA/CDA1 family)